MITVSSAIPHTSGVYLFKKGKTLLYIGKAANLKKRLASYFRKNASDKVRRLREEATALEWQETNSEIEALIREAELIKRHLPKYNVLMRDDKSYFYVAVTREEFPKIFIAHQPRAKNRKPKAKFLGPFTSGSALFGTLKLLRKIFPYCTCKQLHKRPCLNAEIGRCLGFCCGKNKLQHAKLKAQNGEYKKNIKNVIAVLSGKRKRIASGLMRSMRDAAKKQEFERAAKLRDQWEALENIFAHRSVIEVGLQSLQSRNRRLRARAWPRIEREIQALLGTDRRIRRVEGYDISNISGSAASGSMVVFLNGMPAKSEYRKFKIKTVRGANDVAMHTEVMRRRMAHAEWPYPDLIVMDGGKAQLHAALSVWKFLVPSPIKSGTKFQRPIITALAKREEELYSEGRGVPVRLDALSPDARHFFQRGRDESHRFAKKYHHKIRELALKN